MVSKAKDAIPIISIVNTIFSLQLIVQLQVVCSVGLWWLFNSSFTFSIQERGKLVIFLFRAKPEDLSSQVSILPKKGEARSLISSLTLEGTGLRFMKLLSDLLLVPTITLEMLSKGGLPRLMLFVTFSLSLAAFSSAQSASICSQGHFCCKGYLTVTGITFSKTETAIQYQISTFLPSYLSTNRFFWLFQNRLMIWKVLIRMLDGGQLLSWSQHLTQKPLWLFCLVDRNLKVGRPLSSQTLRLGGSLSYSVCKTGEVRQVSLSAQSREARKRKPFGLACLSEMLLHLRWN